ncbi:MAG: hypothetical protein QXW73_06655, partial [Nitrososphaerales archaeon]
RSIRASLIVALIRGSINLDPRPTASIGTSDLYDFAYRLINALEATELVLIDLPEKYAINT